MRLKNLFSFENKVLNYTLLRRNISFLIFMRTNPFSSFFLQYFRTDIRFSFSFYLIEFTFSIKPQYKTLHVNSLTSASLSVAVLSFHSGAFSIRLSAPSTIYIYNIIYHTKKSSSRSLLLYLSNPGFFLKSTKGLADKYLWPI
jgi:hypothetical protein